MHVNFLEMESQCNFLNCQGQDCQDQDCQGQDRQDRQDQDWRCLSAKSCVHGQGMLRLSTRMALSIRICFDCQPKLRAGAKSAALVNQNWSLERGRLAARG